MVLKISSQASFSYGVLIRFRWIELTRPWNTRTQSSRKNSSSASAVATCRATISARYGEFALVMLRSEAQEPPMNTGNSSVTPWTRPSSTASA